MTCPTKELLEKVQADDQLFILTEIAQAVQIVTDGKERIYGPCGLTHYDETVNFLNFKFGESFDVKRYRSLLIRVLIASPSKRLEYHSDGSATIYSLLRIEGYEIELSSQKHPPSRIPEDGPFPFHDDSDKENQSPWALWKRACNKLSKAAMQKRDAKLAAKSN